MWYLITGEVVVLLGTLLPNRAHVDARVGPAFAAAVVSVLVWPLLVGALLLGIISGMGRARR